MNRLEHLRCTLSIPISQNQVVTVVLDTVSQELDGAAADASHNGVPEGNDFDAGARAPMGFQLPRQ